MIIVLKPKVTQEEIDHIVNRIKKLDPSVRTHISSGEERTIIGVIGKENVLREQPIELLDGVESVMPILKPYKLASKEFHTKSTVIEVEGKKIGGDYFAVIGGPCSVESEEQTIESLRVVKEAGAHFIRGGAYKPRTSPYDFAGLEEEGLKILFTAKKELGLPIITEVMDIRTIDTVLKYADVLQIGARNVQNFNLLREIGKVRKPVLLKRGMMTTIKEWLMAAEYILDQGNSEVILCERGIRTFETETRNTLDLAAVPILNELTHLPVIVDPSHGTGKRYAVIPCARAAVAIGANGVMVETHWKPEEALSDGPQSLRPNEFKRLMDEIKKVAHVMGKIV